MVIVTWRSGSRGEWSLLDSLDLNGLRILGVFMIWYAGSPGRVVHVGQGDVATRLREAQTDSAVQAFKARGKLLVTWAQVSAARIDGIERYLAETWSPLIAGPRSDVVSIPVNSPGWMRAFV